MAIRVLAAGLALATSACALAPGLRMDESRVSSRVQASQAPGEEPYRVTTIDAKVLEAQAAERQKAPQRLPDPLSDLARSWEYRVAPHDVISVIVWDHPELTIPAGEFRPAEATGHPVTADGTMFYPHVGVLPVAGKTLPEVRALLTDRLAKYIQRPQLDVRIAAFRGQKVQVTGDVVQPSSIPISDVPLRAQDAIALARGLGPEADARNVTLTRRGDTFRLDLQALYEEGDLSQNWLLEDGDVLHVPDRSRNKVFVLGEVRRPQSRIMVKGRMTLAEAIGDTEGFDPITSNPGKVYVIRGAFDRPQIFRLDAKSPDALLLATQFQLRPADVVYVSTYELTRWNRIVQQILPTIQGIWQTVDIGNRTVTYINP